MTSWKTRAALGALKSMLPFKPQLRQLKRNLFPYETNPKNDPGLLDQSLRQVGALADLGISVKGKTVVELGTGWLPILPLVYRMAGAARVITVDQERLTDRHTFANAIRSIQHGLDREIRNTGVEPGLFDRTRLPAAASDLRSLCEQAQVELKSPFDFNDMPTDSCDIVASRTVLEHISESGLQRIFRSTKRILRAGGVMCHTIDMSDHREHLDKSISRVNFLKYRPWIWRLACADPQLYQNRLRRFEYETMLHELGFDILLMTGTPDAGALQALADISVCGRYKGVRSEALAILDATIIAKAH